jgi:hypothetical protein
MMGSFTLRFVPSYCIENRQNEAGNEATAVLSLTLLCVGSFPRATMGNFDK